MTHIKYKSDYGYPEAPDFWAAYRADPPALSTHESYEAAEKAAAALAIGHPGMPVHVLGLMGTVSTKTELVGERFDPKKKKPVMVAAEDVAERGE